MLRLTFLGALCGTFLSVLPANAATFLFIRHAESTANSGEASTPEEILNPPLTALGKTQASALVNTLADIDLTTIYVSGYQRTALTIAETAADHGLTPIVTPAINEWSAGDASLTDYSAIYQMMGQWAAGNTSAGIEGVPSSESLDDLVARVLPAYQQILADHVDEDGTVAIVAHGGSIAWVLPYLVGNLSLGYALSNGLANTGIVEVQVSGGTPYVTNWQGTEFDWPGTDIPAVPLPASGLLLLGALGGLGLRARRRKAV